MKIEDQCGERRWRVKKEEKEQLEGEKRNEENRQNEENSIQITVSKSKKGAKPTPDGEGRG